MADVVRCYDAKCNTYGLYIWSELCGIKKWRVTICSRISSSVSDGIDSRPCVACLKGWASR